MIEKKWKNKYLNKKIIIFSLIILLIISGLFYLSLFYKKNCRSDLKCFSQALQNCNKAKVTAISNNNLYQYQILRDKGETCKINIKVLKLAPGSSIITQKKFEDKAMTCLIPRDQLNQPIDEIKELINYCTGPLKEALLQDILENIYTNIVKNLGNISQELKSDI